jgi:biopolymer transport protein ExbD
LRVRLLLTVLIILLSSVPLSQERSDVFLPAETADDDGGGQVVVEYSADRRITVNSQVVPASELAARLHELYRRRKDKTMWLSASGALKYGEVMDVIDAAKGAGVGQVGVITPAMRAQR